MMQTAAQTIQPASVSQKMRWAGLIMSMLPVLMLLMSAAMKFMKPAPVVEGFAHLGFPENLALGLGILELACTIVYLIPQTSVLGAILVTGYLGGATVTHLRVGDPFFMPVILGVLVWGGLFLREPRLRALIPLRREPARGRSASRETQVEAAGK
jgi:DoxX-like family